MKTTVALLGAVVLSAWMAGCVTKGRHFPSDLSWITKEVTKKNDVLLLLGRPFMVGNAGGIMTWSYGRYNYSLVGHDYIKELKIYWNDDDTVRDYSFQSSFPSDMHKAGVIDQRQQQGKQDKAKSSLKNTKHTGKHELDKVLESVIEGESDLEAIFEDNPMPPLPSETSKPNVPDMFDSVADPDAMHDAAPESPESANHQ